ncbi:MAG: alpha-amylase [Lachnospiraceae bacterium]|nr:alpha-amylase [Lachnospiraceae bacterium]
MKNINRTMMQYFEWYLPEDSLHWQRAAKEAASLYEAGINMVWLPPAYKGAAGKSDVGYGVYDIYDLGEFDQKGSIPTKYGTKDEYLDAIKAMHEAGIEVLGDMVFNHMMGADETETVMARRMDSGNRFVQISDMHEIEAWTKFTFPGRKGKYFDYVWTSNNFDGVDWDNRRQENGVFLFKDKNWDNSVDEENGNFDYLMGADLALDNPEVAKLLTDYGYWYTDLTGIDGYRLDAVKHIASGFYKDWLNAMRAHTGKEMFAVGEYWNPGIDKLLRYIELTNGEMSLFDVPLHFHFNQISNANSGYPMSLLLRDTLAERDPMHAVTFVENHDTQPGQALESPVAPWLKPIAYAIILLQERGLPCVFYGDYYGIPHSGLAPVKELKTLLKLRQTMAYGPEHDYYDDDNIVGFTREGDDRESGLAVLLSDAPGGTKKMYIGSSHAGQTFYDALGKCQNRIVIDEEGFGVFETDGGSVSVWISEIPG